jgi:uncharacterized glyoxalase superfamily protein PhnB
VNPSRGRSGSRPRRFARTWAGSQSCFAKIVPVSEVATRPPFDGFNRTMPPSTVIPVLVYEDVEETIGWLCDKFGFEVRWQVGDHRAQLWLNGGTVVITEPRTSQALGGRQSLLVRVPDVLAHCARARERGAKILDEPRDFQYGERQYTAEDLGGHHWCFSQSIADVLPEDWGGTSGPALHAPGPPAVTHLRS